MMKMQQKLSEKIEQALHPSHLSVDNESDQHSGPATESHFKVVVVAEKFQSLTLIERHRLIHKLLAGELKIIHALALHTYTEDEWAHKKSAPDSPQCEGGS